MASVITQAGDEPQLVFSNSQSAQLLAESASRFRYNPEPLIAGAAEVVWWCCTRREIPGSHSAVVLTDVLAEHFAIGVDGGTTDDLRVWLAWIGATGHDDLAGRLAERDGEPPDPKTTLDFDEALWPRVERRDTERAARRVLAAESSSESDRRRAERDLALQARNRSTTVVAALKSPMRATWNRIVVAAKLIEADPRPLLASIEQFCTADQKAWEREMRRRERGFAMSRRDSPRAAVMGLAEAEVAESLWNGALVWDDPVARAEALAAGDAVAGVVVSTGPSGATVLADGGPVRARVGDTLTLEATDGPIEVEVVDVSDEASGVGITVEWEGMLVPLEVGQETALWPPPPDYGRRWLGWLSGRLSEKHWLLGDSVGPAESAIRPHEDASDPLAAVMALRKGA
jgi:hypothetical protein